MGLVFLALLGFKGGGVLFPLRGVPRNWKHDPRRLGGSPTSESSSPFGGALETWKRDRSVPLNLKLASSPVRGDSQKLETRLEQSEGRA